MPKDGPGSRNIYYAQRTDKRETANAAPLNTLDSVEGLIAKYRGSADEIKLGIQAAVLGSLAIACALSMIPFEANFGGEYAGKLMMKLVAPGVDAAINSPVYDYLENIFPTKELNVRLLVTGLESGALTDDDLVDTAVDSGLKDKEIKKLLKIARIARFEKNTAADNTMLTRYQNAVIAAAIDIGRLDIDDEINARLDRIKQLDKIIAGKVLEVTSS